MPYREVKTTRNKKKKNCENHWASRRRDKRIPSNYEMRPKNMRGTRKCLLWAVNMPATESSTGFGLTKWPKWPIIAALLGERINLALIGFNIMLSVRKKREKKAENRNQQTPIKSNNRDTDNQDGNLWSAWSEEEGSEDSEEQLAKCGTFSNVPVLALISGFHAIAKKKKRRGRNMWKQWARPLKEIEMIVIMGKLQQHCNKRQPIASKNKHTHKHIRTLLYIHMYVCTCMQTYLNCAACPFGLFGALTARQAHCAQWSAP